MLRELGIRAHWTYGAPSGSPLLSADQMKAHAAKVGKEMDVLIDEVDDQGAVARCYADAPEIDGSVFIASTNVNPGDKVRVRIVDADEYDMWAELI